MKIDILIQSIRSQGGRITPTRKAILTMLTSCDCLMSQADIILYLRKRKIHPNRSTLFRELLFLSQNHIVTKNTITGVDYYEIPDKHHHHLVCLQCKTIEKVEIGNHLERQEKEIFRKNHFNITGHSLEFYGYCRHCKS